MSDKFKLVQTCGGCPESYDVYYDGKYVGYLHLQYGCFQAECHDEVVYTATPRGDGIFEFEERDFYLNEACKAIKARLETQRSAKEDLLFKVVDKEEVHPHG